jgi:hypothetical protein
MARSRARFQARSIISHLIDVADGTQKSGLAVVDNLASDPA